MIQIELRKENELYLRGHPELKGMLAEFTKEVLTHQPDDPKQFAVQYFTDPALFEESS